MSCMISRFERGTFAVKNMAAIRLFGLLVMYAALVLVHGEADAKGATTPVNGAATPAWLWRPEWFPRPPCRLPGEIWEACPGSACARKTCGKPISPDCIKECKNECFCREGWCRTSLGLCVPEWWYNMWQLPWRRNNRAV